MVIARVLLGRVIAFAFLRDDVQELASLESAQVTQGGREGGHVMPVNRPDVIKTKFFEQSTGHEHAFYMFFPAPHELPGSRQVLQDAPATFTDTGIEAPGQDACQVIAHGAPVWRDGHFIIIQYDQQVAVQVTGVIEGLVGHPGGHGTVADNCNRMMVPVLHGGCSRHTQCSADRGAGVPGPEGIVLTFLAVEKTTEPVTAAQAAHCIAPAGQDFVGIGLVPDIPDQSITGCIKDMVQGDRQFDGPESRRQVTAGGGDGFNQELTEFISQLCQFARVQRTQVGR